MIKYLKHQEISKHKWDDCIRNSSNGLIYAYSWYLDIVCPGWEALVEDDYSSVMPLPVGKKYGYTYTYPPLFTQQLGLFSVNDIADNKTMEFISAIPSHFRYIEMHLNEKNHIASKDLEVKELVTYVLDMNCQNTDRAALYSSQAKRNLKKALTSSLTIVQSARPAKIVKLFRDNRGLEHELPIAFYTVLEQLIEALIHRELVKPMGVNDKNNELCAGAFFVNSNDRDIFLFSGANQIAYDTHAMTLLINNYLEEQVNRSTLFDFEGSMDADLPRFYAGFGSVKRTYLMIRKNTLPAPVKWLKEFQYKRKSISAG